MSLTALKKRFFHPAWAILPLLVLVLCLFSGCQSDDPLKPTRIDDFEYTSVVNNHLTMMDFAYHLQDSGLKVVQVQPIRADVLRATGACAILIDNDEIGVYYFNTDVEQQRKILAQYHEDGFAYILGFRFPVFISGSYVVTGAEKHPKKKEIVKALRSFK
ncbi:MAG: hypothetical protein E7047_00950 [Lentisphaerae bacterium]|nr:hypothetical protein [Lentisphaerota bacterium]